MLESLIQLVLWVIREFAGNTGHLYQDADGGQADQGEGYQDVEGKEVIKSQQISGLMLGIDSEPSLT